MRDDADVVDEHELLAAVAGIAPLIQEDSAFADAENRLSTRVVDALQRAGVLRMRLPAEFGGRESSVSTQMRVIAALAQLDASTGWCVMVENNAVSTIATTMPSVSVERVFADGIPICSLVAPVGGVATPIEGGFTVAGKWRLASGIDHSEWTYASSFIEGDRSRVLRFVVPSSSVQLENSWQAVGLRGTGSADFTLDDVFVPDTLAASGPAVQLRGIRRYDLPGLPVVEAYEHLAFAIGVGRRALQELIYSLASDEVHRRTADREVVHSELGRASTRLAAAEGLASEFGARVDEASIGSVNRLDGWGSTFLRAVAVEATETALECVLLAFRRGASRSVYSPNIVERLLRDMTTASTHIIVDDTAFADYGGLLLAESVSSGRKN